MSEAALIVMAKSPEPGRVKTRLCPPCTPAEAARIALGALLDTLDAVVATPARRHVLALDGPAGEWLDGYPVEVIGQRGVGLDERLAAAFDDVGGPAVLVGMDTPQIGSDELVRALGLLESGCAAVFGPADDGGFWAVGVRRSDPLLFLGVPMSTRSTGMLQLERLRERAGVVGVLEPLLDVDEWRDALAVAREVPGTRFAAEVARIASCLPVEVANRAE